MLRGVLFLFLSLVIVSCSSTTMNIDDLNIPLAEIQKIVNDNMPIRTKRVSSNGREFYSEYFVTNQGNYEEAPNAHKRAQALVTVLDDRRPYNITIVVKVEERNPDGEYVIDHYDEGLARVLSRRIQKALHDRREDRNIIDDFRIF